MADNTPQMNNEQFGRNFRESVCADVYTTVPGDTLYSIANRYNVRVDSLMILNQIRNPFSLLVGQQLCIPRTLANTRECQLVHRIQEGDTLYLVAKRYNIPLNALMNANANMDPYNLQIGDVLCIPEAMDTGRGTSMGNAGAGGTGYKPTASTNIQQEEKTPSNAAEIKKAADSPGIPGAVVVSGGEDALQPVKETMGQMWNHSHDENCINGVEYTVRPGESLTTILDKFGLSFASLMNKNPSVDFSASLEGMALCIPSSDTLRRCRMQDSYIVRYGDNINTIAENAGVSTDDLLRYNPLCNVMDFSTRGMKVCLPR